jgi:hypothetical protein
MRQVDNYASCSRRENFGYPPRHDWWEAIHSAQTAGSSWHV